MFGIETQTLLGLSVVGALVTTVGSLIAAILKDVVLARSFERWKTRQSLASVYRKYRDPIVFAAIELHRRYSEISQSYPPSYLSSSVLKSRPRSLTRPVDTDAYYLKYKLLSTAYRLCALLGWIELYRQDLTFLDSGSRGSNQDFDTCIRAIQAHLADGQLNDASDWESWHDVLIFREEQRAIGEAMIRASGPSRSVMGYGAFCELFDSDAGPSGRWLVTVSNFLLDPASERDFRRVRLQLLAADLVDLVDVLDHARVTTDMEQFRVKTRRALPGR